MGVVKYILVSFKNDLKKNIFYISTMTFAIVLIFNVFNIIFNESIITYNSEDYGTTSLLGLVIMGVSILFMILSNSYYLEDKYKEYGVIISSGKSIFEVCIIITIRNLIVSIIAILLGGCIVTFTSPMINGFLYELIGIEGNTGYISEKTISMIVIVIVTQFFIVFLINSGSIYRKKVNELMNIKRQAFKGDNRVIRIKPYLYIGIYLVPIIVLIIPVSVEDKVPIMAELIIVAIFGIQGIIRHVIPGMLGKLRKDDLVVDRYKLIVISNLQYSIQKSLYLIIALVVSMAIIIVIVGQYKLGTAQSYMALMCYIIVILAMSLTIVYKFLIESKKRKENFRQLKLLGYTIKEIKKIVNKEVFVYYSILITLTLIHMILMLVVSILAGYISINSGIFIVIVYLGVFIATALISNLGYKKAILT